MDVIFFTAQMSGGIQGFSKMKQSVTMLVMRPLGFSSSSSSLAVLEAILGKMKTLSCNKQHTIIIYCKAKYLSSKIYTKIHNKEQLKMSI